MSGSGAGSVRARTVRAARVLGVVCVVTAGAALSGSAAAVAAPASAPDAGPAVTPGPSAVTVPHWTGSFVDPTDGQTYSYTLVGNGDPRTASGTTSVPVDLVPVGVEVDGRQFSAAATARLVLASPIFQSANFPQSGDSGVQYGDAIMRSEFNRVGSDYHLTLAPVTAHPAVMLDVPAGKGYTGTGGGGLPTVFVDGIWFEDQVHSMLANMHTDPRSLTVFVTPDLGLLEPHGVCCYSGYHRQGDGRDRTGPVNGDGAQTVHTWIWASIFSPGILAPYDLPYQDISVLSHEVAEWENDPFSNNVVQPYRIPPGDPFYGGECANVFESSDPVELDTFTLPGNPEPSSDGLWHPENAVFLPWFSREDPNLTSQDGRYTFLGSMGDPAFAQPATNC